MPVCSMAMNEEWPEHLSFSVEEVWPLCLSMTVKGVGL